MDLKGFLKERISRKQKGAYFALLSGERRGGALGAACGERGRIPQGGRGQAR